MKNTLVLVADLAGFKTYRLDNNPMNSGPRLEPLETFENPDAHGKIVEKVTDMAGTGIPGSSGRTAAGCLQAWFSRPGGGLWPVALSMLPAHDTAYAATVHQAQGSECAEVLLLMPLQDNRILSWELVYTGLTRARHKLTLADPASLLAGAVCRRAVRYSGLTDRLWR